VSNTYHTLPEMVEGERLTTAFKWLFADYTPEEYVKAYASEGIHLLICVANDLGMEIESRTLDSITIGPNRNQNYEQHYPRDPDVAPPAVKPPLGLMPKRRWIELRLVDVNEAIARYEAAKLPVPREWIGEVDGLTRAMEIFK